MKSKLIIHFWDISGYVNIDFETKKFILEKILQTYSLNGFSKEINLTNVSLAHFLKNKDSFIRINNLLELLSKLHLSKNKIEKSIIAYRDTSSKDFFSIHFPYKLSPPHFRVTGVLIGDGHIHKKNNLLRWIQKDITPMKKLLESIIKIDVYIKKGSSQIVIPSFFGKIVCVSLDLKFTDLVNEKFIEKCLNLPRDYGLALLLALIEDEGNIDVRNYGGINIRMSSKKIIYSIKKLCNYLGYSTSEIIKYDNKGNFGRGIMYKININAEGIRKLGLDVINFEKKFGKQSSLWRKRDNFFRRFEICKNDKSKKNLEGREIHDKILRLLEDKSLSPLQISEELGIDYSRISSLIKNMFKRGEVKRIDRGIYTT